MKGKKVTKWIDLELETGDVVVHRNGNVSVVIGDYIVNKNSFLELKDYDDDFLFSFNWNYNKNLDIIKVYDVEGFWGNGLEITLNAEYLKEEAKLIWERED